MKQKYAVFVYETNESSHAYAIYGPREMVAEHVNTRLNHEAIAPKGCINTTREKLNDALRTVLDDNFVTVILNIELFCQYVDFMGLYPNPAPQLKVIKGGRNK